VKIDSGDLLTVDCPVFRVDQEGSEELSGGKGIRLTGKHPIMGRLVRLRQSEHKAGNMNELPANADRALAVCVRRMPIGSAGCKRGNPKALPIKTCVAAIAGFAFLCAGLLVISGVCLAQQARVKKPPVARPASDQGKRSFVAHCAPCHGLDGRGGEHAPAIVGTPAAQARTDGALARTIRSGIPDKGMPSFHFLTNQQIGQIVSYIHALHGTNRVANLKGDPATGAKLFFGEARCSDCHMMHGKGGFIGSDLSEFGLTHTAGDIRQIILQPNKALMTQSQRVTVVTHSGQHFSGLVRNEDNFSIALLSENGEFHLLMKSEIARIAREQRSIMPDDYGKELSSDQLDDLASFLILGSVQESSRGSTAGATRSK
jgi:cytochrome c oxidase cbb3-type subunit III